LCQEYRANRDVTAQPYARRNMFGPGLPRRIDSGIHEYVCEYVCRAFDRATGLDKLISTSRATSLAAVERS